jgi:hypothetical protein
MGGRSWHGECYIEAHNKEVSMVTLRHKLFFGFGGLLLIILIVGIQSISRLTQLGGSIDVILRENYRSIIACERMKEALERMDSGAVLLLLGEREMGADLIGTNMPRFEQALQTELDNITLPGEEERAFRIKQLFPNTGRAWPCFWPTGRRLPMFGVELTSRSCCLFFTG